MLHARPDYNRIQDPEGKIGDDEPVFLIRATDAVAPMAIRAWADEAERAGASREIVGAAKLWAERVVAWQGAHPELVHVPDLPDTQPARL